MRCWQAAVPGLACFLLASRHPTSIVLGDDGQVLGKDWKDTTPVLCFWNREWDGG